MKLSSSHHPQPSRSLLLFPLFSLLFHITLFFLLQVLSGPAQQAKQQEEEIIAMVDLENLQLPEEIDHGLEAPEKLEAVLPPKLVIPSAAPEPGLEGEESREENNGLPPELGAEAVSALPGSLGEGLPEAPEALQEAVPLEEEVASTEAQGDTDEAQVQAEPEAPIEQTAPEPEAEESLELPTEAIPDEAALALNEAPPEEAVPEEASADSLTEETGGGPDFEAADAGESSEENTPEASEEVSSEAISPTEVAASESLEALEPAKSKAPVPAQEEIKEAKTSPRPPKKPSKVKIKKVGLLGLLGAGASSKHKRGRRLMAKNRLRSENRAASNKSRFPRKPLKAGQKIAGLRKKVLSSEKKRLMRRRPLGRRGKPGIKIVHGSGRNYGVISAAIHQKKGQLTNVYNRRLQNDENLQGNLIIEFVISPQGRVIKSTILTSSIGNPSFERALIKEIRRWKFPSVKTGQTTVLYPLSFFPSG